MSIEYDTIEKIRNSLVQHGKYSDRVYLMKLVQSDLPVIFDDIDLLADENNYSKAFVKVPETIAGEFERRGYEKEAIVPHFYHGEVSGVFLSKYFTEDRRKDERLQQIEEIIALAKENGQKSQKKCEPMPQYELTCAKAEDVYAMSEVYKTVFPSYPFPIHDPAYLSDTMQSHIDYFVVRHEGKIIALSSAEMDKHSLNVEMTDFATLPKYRRKGIAQWLLFEMEVSMKKRGMKVAYTIARSLSAGMNITFARCGYMYAGTLINNTNISGSIESMNVWYKKI